MKPQFDHEKLHVYQKSLSFVKWVTLLLDRISPRIAVVDQLDRASALTRLSIAEGNGRAGCPQPAENVPSVLPCQRRDEDIAPYQLAFQGYNVQIIECAVPYRVGTEE